MPTIVTDFNFGDSLLQNPQLNRQLAQIYTTLAQTVNTKISKYFTDGVLKPHVNPPASSQFNRNFDICDIYVRSDTNTAWIMTSRTSDIAVTWTQIT